MQDEQVERRATDVDLVVAPVKRVLSTRADRARLRGARRQPPVTTDFEVRILREHNRKVLHAGAVSSLVSTAFLEALFMTTTSATLERIIPRNPRAPLWVIGHGVHADFDADALASFAVRMGRPDLVDALTQPIGDRRTLLRDRWVELGGGEAPADEPRLPSGT